MRAAVARRTRKRVLEQLELVVAADERRDRHTRRSSSVCGRRRPGPDRLVAPADLDRADVVDLEPPEREPVRRGAEQALSGLCELLEAGCDVDRLARRERRISGAGHALARLDADARLQLELVDRIDDLERSADRALRVVLMRLRDSECGHHGVARELLDGSAMTLDAVRGAVEELRDAPAHDFRVARG